MVLQISNQENGACTVNLPAEELAKHAGLQAEYTAESSLASVLAALLCALARKPLEALGDYKSEVGNNSVKCALGTNTGMIFPLEKFVVFLPKPPMMIRVRDIASVEFSRYANDVSLR